MLLYSLYWSIAPPPSFQLPASVLNGNLADWKATVDSSQLRQETAAADPSLEKPRARLFIFVSFHSLGSPPSSSTRDHQHPINVSDLEPTHVQFVCTDEHRNTYTTVAFIFKSGANRNTSSYKENA